MGLLLLGALSACSAGFDESGRRVLTVTPAVYDVGTVTIGEADALSLSLSADGGDISVAALELNHLSGDGFELADAPLPIVASGSSAQLDLMFTPGVAGPHEAELTIWLTEGEDGATVVLRGEGAEPVIDAYPTLLDFGPVAAGGSVSAEMSLMNAGRAPVTIDDLSLGDGAFVLRSDLPQTIEPGRGLDLVLRFDSDGEEHVTDGSIRGAGGGARVAFEVRANACASADGTVYDTDGDGFSACDADCDDTSAGSNPAAREVCDERDNDCDGDVDEGTECSDDDADGYTEAEGDCDDTTAEISPGVSELAGNGVDDDCDGVADGGYGDGDGDGWSLGGGDCDDTDPGVHPHAPESADGVDEDCDGLVDEGTAAVDDDGDGFSEDDGDCDDTDAQTYPGAPETADFVDDDCDGDVDEGTSQGDDDGDGWTEDGGDCNDGDPRVNPGAQETAGNGIDDDCDGTGT